MAQDRADGLADGRSRLLGASHTRLESTDRRCRRFGIASLRIREANPKPFPKKYQTEGDSQKLPDTSADGRHWPS